MRGERTNTDMTNYSLVLEHAAARHAVRYVSLAGLLVEADLAEDGVHLSDSGYEKLTERVLNELGVLRSGVPVDE